MLIECSWCGGQGFTRAEDGSCKYCGGVGKVRAMTVGAVMASKTPKRRKWLGSPPRECDLCHEKITDSFVDGATIHGPWACMCRRCCQEQGRGLGTGLGQLYEKEADGVFYKTQG